MGPAGEALLGRGEVDGSTSLFLAQRHARWAGFDERKKRSVVANAAIARELAGQASAGNSKRDTDRACGVPVASEPGNVAPTSNHISCQQGGQADGAGGSIA
jgi:hypothetical protein